MGVRGHVQARRETATYQRTEEAGQGTESSRRHTRSTRPTGSREGEKLTGRQSQELSHPTNFSPTAVVATGAATPDLVGEPLSCKISLLEIPTHLAGTQQRRTESRVRAGTPTPQKAARAQVQASLHHLTLQGTPQCASLIPTSLSRRQPLTVIGITAYKHRAQGLGHRGAGS